jgi:hypothetical protein
VTELVATSGSNEVYTNELDGLDDPDVWYVLLVVEFAGALVWIAELNGTDEVEA